MLNIPSEVKALFSSDKVHKNFHVHFPNGETTDLNNENILSESVQFTESLCSHQYFKFGLAEASQIEFTAVGIPNILGATIECATEIDCSSLDDEWAEDNPIDSTLEWLEPQTCEYDGKVYYRVPYGRFVVDSCPRNHGAMTQRKITAYSENMINGIQVLAGEYPNSSIVFNPMDWLLALSVDKATMQTAKYRASTGSTAFLERISGDNSSGLYLSLRGVGSSYKYEGSSFWGDITPSMIGKYILIVDYKEHPFDDYGKAFYDLMMANLPSGSYIYGQDGQANYVKEFANNEQSTSLFTGVFQPCIYIDATYHYEVSSTVTKFFYRHSKPIFIKPNTPILLDFSSADNFKYFIKPPSGYTLSGYQIYVSVPMKWQNEGIIRMAANTYDIAGWGSVAPFDSDIVTRDGEVVAYLKKIESDDFDINVRIQNTLEYKKTKGLGKYYTYSNAVSALRIIEGLMELTGEFYKVYRTGVNNFFKIGENQTLIPVSASDWSEFWWDENEVEPIGTVNAKFPDDENGGEESIMTFTIGDGASVYTMEDNEVLENTTASQDELQDVIDEYFAPNAEVINFTPVDLTMRGLPYLEAGDKIQLTADDGETVETYILEQTISGIQHLTADITSTNGELLEVIDE